MDENSTNFFRMQATVLRLIGLARIDNHVNRTILWCSFASVLIMKLGTLLYAIEHIDEIMLLCDCLGPTLTAYLGLLRQFYLHRNRSALWGTVNEFVELKRSLKADEKTIVERFSRFDRLLAWTYLVSVMFTSVLIVIAALVVTVAFGKWKLPLLMRFPVDMDNPMVFCVFFAWCSVAIFWAACDCVACDASFGTLCSSLVAHFVIIQSRFESFDFRRNDPCLGTLIEYHKYILALCKRTIDTFKFVILNQLLISSGLLCMLGFQLVLSTGTYLVVVYIFYGTAIIIQVTYYCYYGSQLLHESSQVTEAIYGSNWYEADVKTQKMLISCMMRAKKAVNLKAGFMEASLPTLKAILNSAGSYVALLMSFTD